MAEYHVPEMPPAEYQTIDNIHWQIQQERPDNADAKASSWGMVVVRVDAVRGRLLDIYRDLGSWTSPAAKVSFFTRVVTTRVDLEAVRERAAEVRDALRDLAAVMRAGQTDMQELHDEYAETMAAWDEAYALDREDAELTDWSSYQAGHRRFDRVEQESRVGWINTSQAALHHEREAFTEAWDELAREERDRIAETYDEALGKLPAPLPVMDVLDTRPHPKAFNPDFTPPPGGVPGPGAPPVTAAPTGPAAGDVLAGAAPPAPAGTAPPLSALPPAALAASRRLAGGRLAPGNAPDVEGAGAPQLPDPSGPATPGAPAAPPLLPVVNPGGLGAGSAAQGSRPTIATPLPPGAPNGGPRPARAPGNALSAPITPQPPGSVITSPASSELTGAGPTMPALSTTEPPDGGGTAGSVRVPPGMRMPPGMGGGPPATPGRQPPQRSGGVGDRRDDPRSGAPALPATPGQGEGTPLGLRMPPGTGGPPGSQRTDSPREPGVPGAGRTTPPAFTPPMPGTPPVLGGAPQRRRQRTPGGPAEAPHAARRGRTGPGAGTAPPILVNQRSGAPRRTYTEQREANRQARLERAKRFAELLKSQFAKDIPQRSAPVLESRLPTQSTTGRVTEVPAALQARPAPARRAERPADQTPRRASQAADQTPWGAETPGAPVLAGERPQRRERREGNPTGAGGARTLS